METDMDRNYTADEFLEEIPEYNRLCELYDGKIFIPMAPDTEYHRIRDNLLFEINTYIKENKRECEIFYAPFDVKMDDYNVVQPDLLVICDKSKLDDMCCYGSPEFVIAVTSDEQCEKDYINKLYLYEKYGAEEYWIIDPRYKKVISYRFADKSEAGSVPFKMYGFDDDIPVSIFNDDLKININKIRII